MQLSAHSVGNSTSAEAFVAYASSGVLAGEIKRLKYFCNIIFWLSSINGACEDGSGYNVVVATAKFEIRREHSPVSPQVNGSKLEL